MSSTSPSPLLDVLINSPRTSTAKKKASSLAQAVGIPWECLTGFCSRILSQVTGNNPVKLEDTIEHLLEMASKASRKLSLINSRFPNLSLLDRDGRALSEAQGAVCDAVMHIHRKRLALDEDKLVYYLLHVADFSINKKKDLALAKTFHQHESKQALWLCLAQSFH